MKTNAPDHEEHQRQRAEAAAKKTEEKGKKK